MTATPSSVAHYAEVARVAMLELHNVKLRMALTDARVFIAQAAEMGILNAEECKPMLECYDKVLKESQ